MMKASKPLSNKERMQQEIERQKNAEVRSINEPSPVLVKIFLTEVMNSNMKRLERELVEKQK